LSFHGGRGGAVAYLRGKLVIGPWSDRAASLVVTKADISHHDVEYDLVALRRALTFHEMHVRHVCFSGAISAIPSAVVPSGRYCSCFDCVTEIVTYQRYAACVACVANGGRLDAAEVARLAPRYGAKRRVGSRRLVGGATDDDDALSQPSLHATAINNILSRLL
jgi:hypothetical protein